MTEKLVEEDTGGWMMETRWGIMIWIFCMSLFSGVFGPVNAMTPTPTPTYCYLVRDLPGEACDGDQITVSLDFYGNYDCTIESVEETVPSGWTVVSPPWDDKIDNTYIWNSAISSYEIVALGFFNHEFSGQATTWHPDDGYQTQATQGDHTIYILLGEISWLNRILPQSCVQGESFLVTMSQVGGPANIIETSETLPEGWTVLSPGGYVQDGNTFTWNTRILEYEVFVAESAEPGTYNFNGHTISTYVCPGDHWQEIGGDMTITIDCIRNGDVNLDGMLTAGDAQAAFEIVLGMWYGTPRQECAADCNGDGILTASDAQAIFMTVLGNDACEDPLF
jgi:hypothetical protein